MFLKYDPVTTSFEEAEFEPNDEANEKKQELVQESYSGPKPKLWQVKTEDSAG
jgi:hypothetical protein